MRTFLDNLPEHYRNSAEVVAIHQALEEVATELSAAAEDLIGQLFVETASWGITQWEEAYGIVPDLTDTIQERREVVLAKIRGSGTSTVAMIKSTAASYTYGEIDVIEDNPNYRFVVKFIGEKGVPKDIEAFKQTLNAIKPAHLAYILEFSYTVWRELKAKTWSELKTKTWGQVKVT